jgi:hypothetical protein
MGTVEASIRKKSGTSSVRKIFGEIPGADSIRDIFNRKKECGGASERIIG